MTLLGKLIMPVLHLLLLPLLSTVKDTSIHIPLELFVALFILLVTSFIGFLTWLTKQVITMARILTNLQDDVRELKDVQAIRSANYYRGRSND